MREKSMAIGAGAPAASRQPPSNRPLEVPEDAGGGDETSLTLVGGAGPVWAATRSDITNGAAKPAPATCVKNRLRFIPFAIEVPLDSPRRTTISHPVCHTHDPRDPVQKLDDSPRMRRIKRTLS
jgi:hypothetical protein